MELPKEIFHYTNAGEDILSNCLLKVTTPNKFNDPFEFFPGGYKKIQDTKFDERWKDDNKLQRQYLFAQDNYKIDLQENKITNFEEFKKWRLTPECRNDIKEKIKHRDFRDFVDRISSEFGVICFSNIKDSILMWSHYANCHYGMLIGFNPSKIVEVDKLLKVEYKDYRVAITFLAKNESADVEEVRKVVATKATCWSYEEEWRILLKLNNLRKDDKGNKFLAIPKDSISSVIFGLRMEDKRKDNIFKIIYEKFGTEVLIQHAVFDSTMFKLSFNTGRT